ncbi:aminopeptidase [Pullulanibacillus pueri]|uniref:Aminopeptidase n=1 Tax=Pullulanibacillus pueri TaxID=1437324 RepID=A0A8J3EKS8_9BACL|nr:aminopeptidase [Pullulanibacillus pueri]MBM7681867.1 aminopeptidase [Pullulanibacillus pueri]GGH76404.1 aminopeptidase [Pullulanibacillus pueri]
MENFNTLLKNYAELAVKIGVNLQKGQTLVIRTPIIAQDFVRLAAKKAYEAGAKNVIVDWSDEVIGRLKFDMAPDEAFEEFPVWKAKGFEQLAEEGAAFMSVSASNPDLLKGVDPKKISTANKAASAAMKTFMQYQMSSKVSWTIVSVPTPEWATKVFPDLGKEEAVEALWEKIFQATRVSHGNPVENWKQHLATLTEKINYLNEKEIKSLHYQAPGTDLTIELADQHKWMGGGSPNSKGTYFVPNMPTEEVFGMPKKTGVNGYVTSTKPLNYGGTLIDQFTLTFEKGRIVDYKAENGEDTLKHLIETDEGSHYLGEVALVPHHSPISDTGIIFFNTLFDENASCHLAIGKAYPFNIKGGSDMTQEELAKLGANDSLTHVDFMMGSAEMSIDATTASGEVIPLFRNGNWAV